MKDNYQAVFRNLKTERRSDFGNVYDPYEEVNIWNATWKVIAGIVAVALALAVMFR